MPYLFFIDWGVIGMDDEKKEPTKPLTTAEVLDMSPDRANQLKALHELAMRIEGTLLPDESNIHCFHDSVKHKDVVIVGADPGRIPRFNIGHLGLGKSLSSRRGMYLHFDSLTPISSRLIASEETQEAYLEKVAEKYAIDPEVLRRVMQCESGESFTAVRGRMFGRSMFRYKDLPIPCQMDDDLNEETHTTDYKLSKGGKRIPKQHKVKHTPSKALMSLLGRSK